MMPDLREKIISYFHLLEQSINGKSTSALHAARKLAISVFEKQGFPTQKNEEWKYTDVKEVLENDFQIENRNFEESDLDNYIIPALEAINIVVVNGVFNAKLSSNQILPQGLVIENLKDILFAEKFSKADLKGYKPYNNDGFISLNEAFVENGVYIEVADNQHLELPVAIYLVAKDNSFHQPKILMKVGNNASIQLIEIHCKEGNSSSLTNSITEISQQSDSHVKYYKIQYGCANENHVGTTQVNQIGKGIFNGVTITLGGNVIRNNFNVTFGSAFSETHLYGLALINGTTHVDNHTVVDHAVPNCESTELYKNIVDDSASAVFNGKIFVRKDAQKTNAYQSSKNILLSKEANAFSKPQLEIWADDVKCSHGSTTGQLDKEALFYLRARGIGEKQAKAMLTKAYVNDILDKIEIPSLRKQLEQLIENRFE
ncbi:MAG: Fe-S cluster assembly protein SufD [Cytophagales bacterium]